MPAELDNPIMSNNKLARRQGIDSIPSNFEIVVC